MATTTGTAREEERQAVVAFLQALVALPSINDLNRRRSVDQVAASALEEQQQQHDYDERRVVERIVEEVKQLGAGDEGFSCCVYTKDKDTPRPNVVVSLSRRGVSAEVGKATRGHPSTTSSASTPDAATSNNDDLPIVFTLVAHSDTVPVGDHTRWTHPPFGGQVDETRQVLYGRGACDNKGGIAVALYTLKRLQASLPQDFRGKVILAVVADEESGANSPVGLRHLMDLGVVRPFTTTSSSPPSCCGGSIYCYPGRTVTIGHRGVLRLRINIQGSSLHTGSTDWALKRRGANALTALCEIITRIETYPWSRACHPSFPNLPLTVTPTLFQGGVGESIVPQAASCVVDCRIPPLLEEEEEEEDEGEEGEDSSSSSNGRSSKEVRRRIEAIVQDVLERRNAAAETAAAAAAAGPAGPASAATTRVAPLLLQMQPPNTLTAIITVHVDVPSYHIPHSHPLALACVRAVEAVTGKTPTVRGAGPANEGYLLGGGKGGGEGGTGGGIPCICGFGPIGGNAHGVDEWVEVGESLSETLDVYEKVILEAAAVATTAMTCEKGGKV
jgi:acetylornithine deacetylase/succinyl-diaminopimelate desuccinylase-like protein